jgi:hypothetical protein
LQRSSKFVGGALKFFDKDFDSTFYVLISSFLEKGQNSYQYSWEEFGKL